MMELETKTTKIERDIRKRDRRKIGTSIAAVPVFIYLAFEIPFPISKVGLVLTIFWFLYVIYRLRSVQKYKRPIDLSTSFRQQLSNQKRHLQKQFELISTVLYWYLLPAFVFFCLTIYGFGDPADYGWDNWLAVNVFPFSLAAKWANVGVCIVLYAVIYRSNINSSRKNLTPLIEEIERVEEQLDQSV